jgi:hypothetical protein
VVVLPFFAEDQFVKEFQPEVFAALTEDVVAVFEILFNWASCFLQEAINNTTAKLINGSL